jgi:hypothetical protein
MGTLPYFDIINQGVEAWNNWRKSNAKDSVIPNLRDADLQNRKLQGFDFSMTLLENVNLSGSDLSLTDFSGAVLQNANFTGTYLVGARFCDYYNISVLREDNLIFQSPLAALFENINFYSATFNRTNFISLDLSKVKNLDKCIHLGPSNIDLQTLVLSKKIPRIFLRGCGVPESFIEALPTISDFFSCFISYSSTDDNFTQKLYSDLQNAGVRCWFAPENLNIGAKIRPTIDSAIYSYDKLLLILSNDSVRSQWVEQEVEKALERERKENKTILFPLRIDNTIFEITNGWASYLKNTRNIGNFTNWENSHEYYHSFNRLLRDLKGHSSVS